MSDPTARVLIVDDDRIILDSLVEFLRLEGYEVDAAASLKEALGLIDRTTPDLIIADVNMPQGDGFELLSVVRKRVPETVIIMMTAYGTIESAVEAIKMGAYDYLTKPIVDDEFRLAIERALAQQTLLCENRRLRRQLDMRYGLESLIGRDHRMLKIFELIESVADSNVTVLIQGASGTGKSLTARVIHRLSARRDAPFVEVPAGAIPESLLESELFGHVRGAFTGAVSNKVGKFQAADGGTIFLDEIGTASPALQVKLLRVLQEKQFEQIGSNKTESVDVRVVLATNLDLEAEVKAGRFREDLFYRVSVVTIDLPPLRDRMNDVPLLAERFLQQFAAEAKRHVIGFTTEALQCMQQYHWPGNVRELANVVERCVVLSSGPHLTLDDLPPKLVESVRGVTPAEPTDQINSLKEAVERSEKRIVEAVLQANNWNRQLAAIQLDINRTTLYKKMKRYGLATSPR